MIPVSYMSSHLHAYFLPRSTILGKRQERAQIHNSRQEIGTSSDVAMSVPIFECVECKQALQARDRNVKLTYFRMCRVRTGTCLQLQALDIYEIHVYMYTCFSYVSRYFRMCQRLFSLALKYRQLTYTSFVCVKALDMPRHCLLSQFQARNRHAKR